MPDEKTVTFNRSTLIIVAVIAVAISFFIPVTIMPTVTDSTRRDYDVYNVTLEEIGDGQTLVKLLAEPQDIYLVVSGTPDPAVREGAAGKILLDWDEEKAQTQLDGSYQHDTEFYFEGQGNLLQWLLMAFHIHNFTPGIFSGHIEGRM